MTPRHTVDRHDSQLLLYQPLLYEIEELQSTIERETLSFQHNLIQFLTCTELHTTIAKHATIRLSHPLNASFTDEQTYTPGVTHQYRKDMSTPRAYAYNFQQSVYL